MRRIFVDLDGVMSDFDGFFLQEFGVETKDVTKKEMWKAINSYDRFFTKLPLMSGAISLYRQAINHLHLYNADEVIILTSAGTSNYAAVAEQKKAWVKEHLDENVLVICVKDGLDKASMVQNKGDILIDDWRLNCEAWEAAGGVAIKYENATQAIHDLRELFKQKEAA